MIMTMMIMVIFCQRPLGNGGTNSLQEDQPRRRTTSSGWDNDNDEEKHDNDHNQPRRRTTSPGWDNVVLFRSDPNIDDNYFCKH